MKSLIAPRATDRKNTSQVAGWTRVLSPWERFWLAMSSRMTASSTTMLMIRRYNIDFSNICKENAIIRRISMKVSLSSSEPALNSSGLSVTRASLLRFTRQASGSQSNKSHNFVSVVQMVVILAEFCCSVIRRMSVVDGRDFHRDAFVVTADWSSTCTTTLRDVLDGKRYWLFLIYM